MRPYKRGVSTSQIVIAVVVILVLVAAAFFVATQKPAPATTTSTSSSLTSSSLTSGTSSSTSSSSTSAQALANFGPANKSVFVDDAVTGIPDSLDPANAIYTFDDQVFNNVFQPLVTLVGPNSTQGVVAPALAQSYTVNNDENYTFNIRPGVTFSNGHEVNASVVWFSFVRNMVMNQGIIFINYEYLTETGSVISTTGMSLPWGLLNAVQSATGLPVTTNYALAGKVLNNMLSNFHSDNATIQKVMSYPDQAYAVTGPMTFVINTLRPYPSSFFLPNIAQWWGVILDPAYIDAHGGVTVNTSDSYFTTNGGPGTGPYYIASIGTGFSTVLLKANPTYWGLHASNIPPVLQPAHIPVVVINFALSSTNAQQAFGTNQAQLSYTALSVMSQTWNAYRYKQYTNFNGIFDNFGQGPNSYWYQLNPGRYPTNNTDFRLAAMHAINYTQMLDESYTFNGTVLASNYLGPLTQPWGNYYNPDNLSLYSYNVTLATSLMNQAGIQEHFSLVLPNGTVIGDPKAPQLPPVECIVQAPIATATATQDSILQADLAQIGLSVAVQGLTPAEFFTYTSAASAPNIISGNWGPDFPDPILQQMVTTLTPALAPESYVNLTSINNLIASTEYQTNSTLYLQGIAQLYNITYHYAPDIWLPNYNMYFLKQPYVQGMVFSPYTTPVGMYWYNTIYYVSCTTYLCKG